METRKIKWLDICYILRHNHFGREIDPKEGRPAIILSNPKYIQQYGVAQVLYLTRGTHCDRGEVHPVIRGYGLVVSDSVVRTEQITSVDSTLIGDFISEIPTDFIPILIQAVLKSTNLEEYLRYNTGKVLGDEVALKNEIDKYAKRADIYKSRFEACEKSLKGAESELQSYKASYDSLKAELEKQKKLTSMYRKIAEEATTGD